MVRCENMEKGIGEFQKVQHKGKNNEMAQLENIEINARKTLWYTGTLMKNNWITDYERSSCKAVKVEGMKRWTMRKLDCDGELRVIMNEGAVYLSRQPVVA